MQTTTDHLHDAAVERLAGNAARIADVGTGATARELEPRLPDVEVWTSDTLAGLPLDLDLIVADLSHLSDDDVDGLDRYRRLLGGAADHLSPDGGVLIRYRRQILEAERSELPWLTARLEALQAAAA
jgi:methylase of polypeptide subunit release factors